MQVKTIKMYDSGIYAYNSWAVSKALSMKYSFPAFDVHIAEYCLHLATELWSCRQLDS